MVFITCLFIVLAQDGDCSLKPSANGRQKC